MAPRRTGKSTFLRQDLVPEIEAEDWYPIYVDLWSDRCPNPAELVAEAIGAELDKVVPRPRKAVKALGFQKLGAAGATIDSGEGKVAGGLTIPSALYRNGLSEVSIKPSVIHTEGRPGIMKNSPKTAYSSELKSES